MTNAHGDTPLASAAQTMEALKQARTCCSEHMAADADQTMADRQTENRPIYELAKMETARAVLAEQRVKELEAKVAECEAEHPIEPYWVELKRTAQDLIDTLGVDGYFPTAGAPKTQALRDALAGKRHQHEMVEGKGVPPYCKVCGAGATRYDRLAAEVIRVALTRPHDGSQLDEDLEGLLLSASQLLAEKQIGRSVE